MAKIDRMPNCHWRRLAWALPWIPFLLAATVARGGVDVLTWHNDLARTGQNLAETALTLSNVNSSSFGQLYAVPVDGQVYAQPLIVSALNFPGQGVQDVMYAATEHDTVYACDANSGAVLWQKSLLLPGETPADSQGCIDLTPELGVTATPVIDRASGPNGTIYVAAMSKDGGGHYFQRLHALDLTSGLEEFGGPVDVSGSYPGTGDNSMMGNVIFDPKQYFERTGLLLTGGVLYTTWASHCDSPPFTGWVIGYDESTLAQVKVLNLTPNGSEGSIWASGAAPAVDSSGSIYLMTGNGTFDITPDANGFPAMGDYGNCFIRLSAANNSLQVSDYWTMSNTVAESAMDVDLGSGGPVILPDMVDGNGAVRHLAIGGGKDSHIYIVDRDNMGKFDPTTNNGTVYQDLPASLHQDRGTFGAPAYFNGNVYFGAVNDFLRAFTFTSGRLGAFATSTTHLVYAFPGTTPSVSANGTSNGIVWTLEHVIPGVLHANDARDVGAELYNSNQAANGRDQFGSVTKFAVPTVANGKVYVGSSGSVAVFGLLPAPTPTPTPVPTPTPLPAAAPPVILPNGGTYRKAVKVKMNTATPLATIYFTMDGTDPSTASSVYRSPIRVMASATIKAKSAKSGFQDSVITAEIFTITRKR